MQGVSPAVQERMQDWSIESQRVRVRACFKIPKPSHPNALRSVLTQLTALQTVGSPSIELDNWDLTPALAAAVAAAPAPQPPQPPQPPFPITIRECSVTDEILDVILQMGSRVRGLSAVNFHLKSDRHRGAVWSMAELRMHRLSLKELGRLPRCVANKTCRVHCGEVTLDHWSMVSGSLLLDYTLHVIIHEHTARSHTVMSERSSSATRTVVQGMSSESGCTCVNDAEPAPVRV